MPRETNRNHLRSAVMVCALALAMLAISPATAKGPPAKVTINGPGVTLELEPSGSAEWWNLQIGTFEDFSTAIAEPPDAGPGYEMTRYLETSSGLMAFDRVRYHASLSGGPGYVFYEGIINGQSQYDGKWFHASPSGEAIIHQILTAHGVDPSRQSNGMASILHVFTSQIEGADAWWLLPVAGALLGVAWRLWRRRTVVTGP